MALTPTERSRRLRRHRNGDHGACDPARCGALAKEATAAVSVSRSSSSSSLGARGQALWDELAGKTPKAMQVVLLEACRLADRLDRLDDYLSGRTDAWMRLHSRNDDATTVEVVVDAALAEARQQALALRQLMADLKAGAVAPSKPGGTTRDRVAEQRQKLLAAARVADAAGS